MGGRGVWGRGEGGRGYDEGGEEGDVGVRRWKVEQGGRELKNWSDYGDG